MPKADEFQLVAPNLAVWSAYSKECKCDFYSTAYINNGFLVLIDPVVLAAEAWADLTRLGDPGAILLTSANHLRDVAHYRKLCHIPVVASPDTRRELHEEVDVVVFGKDLVHGMRPILIPGAAIGETAYLSEDGVLAIGDAVINTGNGLQFLPDKYAVDGKQSRESLHQLLALDFHTITFAHGLPVTQGAKEKLKALIG
jgi:glyoxylase-like metal-dependent hydrolase (beta-lactamase superfamily II)